MLTAQCYPVNDTLTGNYIYADIDGDLEGALPFVGYAMASLLAVQPVQPTPWLQPIAPPVLPLKSPRSPATGTSTGSAVSFWRYRRVNSPPTRQQCQHHRY